MWAKNKIFHFRLRKTTLNDISFTFLSYWKTSDLHLILEDFYKKRIVLKNCVKVYLKKNYVEKKVERKICREGLLFFYKNFTNQIFTFNNGKVKYFKKHLAHRV